MHTYTKNEIYALLKSQLALEFNCGPNDFDLENNIITDLRLCEKRRHFSDNGHFFQMATLGGNAVISADSRVHERLSEIVDGKKGFWLFEHDNLMKIEDILRPYGERLCQSHHMFLPETEILPVADICPVKWFEQYEIAQFYAGGLFPNALCQRFDPLRPDVLAAAAYDGDEIIGMAGCSADTPIFWQIGIDVDAAYRSRGIGTYLVMLLKNEIIRRGKIPYYGTSLSNIHSWNIAYNCGFCPAWVEIETESIN